MENSGTSIDNLRNLQELGQASYNVNQNIQFEQGHNAAHHVQQAQQNAYYDMLQQKQQQQKRKQEIDIEELTKDINENIPEDTFFSLGESTEEDKKQGVIPKEWKEPLLLLAVYLLLSQTVVRQTLGNYIKQLNPDAEGKIGFAGVLIFGVIFVAIYFLVKKYLL